MAPKIVVDTSVLIKWFKTRDEDLLKEARSLLKEIETRPLAVELDCPCVTADRRLFERARSLPRVRHLSQVGSLS